MADPASARFVGDVPHYYDTCLGPVLFQYYAEDIAARVARLAPEHVLETAAGTGIVTAKLREKLPAAAHLTVTDLNAPMLDIAGGKLASGSNVTFTPADMAALPFVDGAFDLVVCQFGFMFLPDKARGFSEALRVLRKGGHLLFSVWAPMAANPFSLVAFDVGAGFLPANPPMFYRVPFSYGDDLVVRADLHGAGFTEVKLDRVKHNPAVKDWATFAKGAVYGNPLLAEMQGRGVQPDDVVEAMLNAFRARFGREPATMPLEALVFSAQKL